MFATSSVFITVTVEKKYYKKILPNSTLETQKLYGYLEDLQLTGLSVIESGLSIQ